MIFLIIEKLLFNFLNEMNQINPECITISKHK